MNQKIIDAVKALGDPVSLEKLYEQEVVRLVREQYSMDAELAIQRQRDTKPEEFEEYFEFAEECKEIAYREIYGDPDSTSSSPHPRLQPSGVNTGNYTGGEG